ncbi:ribose 5-phosphate isomerase B [Rhizosaccharibacter radicis]|uniref:Ribose 5-phosphate isomerase B n=1 Tax=Rhizosaccharibacter radicis TaxID=2782605 RepID=A0ABT1VSQ1_9PROT|nr:ribose 5-phosphate isomerase B [Acetobacteraceae bacterium KSS12]
MAIAIGCDEAAFELKEAVRRMLEADGHAVEDFGTFENRPVLYPGIAYAVSRSIVDGRNDRGILFCGTGIGMAISANKVPGIRAAQAHDTYSAERARKSNDAQIVTIGARVVGPELAKSIVRSFLSSEFEAGRSVAKVEGMKAIERGEVPAVTEEAA